MGKEMQIEEGERKTFSPTLRDYDSLFGGMK